VINSVGLGPAARETARLLTAAVWGTEKAAREACEWPLTWVAVAEQPSPWAVEWRHQVSS
jgi:hypothetical protein